MEKIVSVIIADCPCCKNCIEQTDKNAPLICKAFPDGIPKEYIWGPVDVKKLRECNNGYKYEEDLP